MANIFISPQAGEQSTQKYFKTDNGGYRASDLEQILSVNDYENLKSFSEVFFWGNKPNSKSKWEKIETGDFILFYAKRMIVAYSRIIYKTHNPKLAEEIWGWTKTENGDDVLWEYLYFFENPVPIQMPFIRLIDFAGYSKNYVIQGFTSYSLKGSEKINVEYGNVETFLQSFDHRLKKLNIANNFSLSGLILNDFLIRRFKSSLLTKPFVILTGLTGSGKTKLAQAFAMWISASKEQYAIVPVGADWTNREPLLGYPDSLNVKHYVKPDSGVLDILLRASENYMANNNVVSKCKPYFLILDEMNLSHVERYFADFLSTMESGDKIKLYSGDNRYSEFDIQNNPIEASLIPREILLPKNLFIIGTVNIDETTYMFSPKVLDRANTIEFRISEAEMQSYFTNHSKLDMNQLLEDVNANRGKGAGSAVEFMKLAAKEGIAVNKKDYRETFIHFFTELQKAGAEFGYRTANEITDLIAYLIHFEVDVNDAYDIAIIQKLLPKLNGSRSKLNKIIPPLLAICEREGKIIYPLSHEKLTRMKKNADENGFASFAEA
jgi:5-methylcytosine-specific restriction protein B